MKSSVTLDGVGDALGVVVLAPIGIVVFIVLSIFAGVFWWVNRGIDMIDRICNET